MAESARDAPRKVAPKARAGGAAGAPGLVAGDTPKGNVPAPAPDTVTPKFLKRLEEAGLKLNKDGTKVVARGAKNPWDSNFNADQYALMQEAYIRFGLDVAFNAKQFYYTGETYTTPGGSEAPVLVDLTTGRTPNGVISDEQLELLRSKTGYDPAYAYDLALRRNTAPNGYIPSYLQSQEAWLKYKENARAGYKESQAAKTAQPAGSEGQSWLGGFDVDGANQYGFGDVVSMFLQAKGQLDNQGVAQQPYFGIEDFMEEAE